MLAVEPRADRLVRWPGDCGAKPVSDLPLYIETDLDPDQLRERLRAWAPWRYAIRFSNGVSTTEFEPGEFFVTGPLAKFRLFQDSLPDDLDGGRALDVGCNIGHNSLHLGRAYGMQVTGVDVSARNIEVARYLATIGGFDRVRFHLADANQFMSARRFDLILHLGTLLFLRDPFTALRNTVKMLRPGGCLALETQSYGDPEDDGTLCKFHLHTSPADRGAPWWSLGRSSVANMLRSAGCDRVEIVNEWQLALHLYRTVFVAYRA